MTAIEGLYVDTVYLEDYAEALIWAQRQYRLAEHGVASGIYRVACDVCGEERSIDVGKAAGVDQVMRGLRMAGYAAHDELGVVCADCQAQAAAKPYMAPLFELEAA